MPKCYFGILLFNFNQFLSMKKITVLLGTLALLVLAMSSCKKETDTSFEEANLLGLWQESGTEAFVRFTAEKDSTGQYKYGREWDESDGVVESDLVPYGNGWFKYKLLKADLTEIHLMDNGGAEIPKVYTVEKLTDSELVYVDDYKKSHSLLKIAKN